MKSQVTKTLDRLDRVDMEILRMLQDDGRITNADLARQIGLSPPSVLQRVRKLEDSGLVGRYTAILNPGAMGYQVRAVVLITLFKHDAASLEAFKKEVVDIPEVLQVAHLSGEFDYMLQVMVRDVGSYENLIRKRLSNIPGIGKIQSSFVLDSPKDTTALPI